MIAELDSQQPASAYHGPVPWNRRAEIQAPGLMYYEPVDISVLQDPQLYDMFQDGQMLPIGLLYDAEPGVRSGNYYCQFRGGCHEYFDKAETLQTHFEIAHFQYTRIRPAHRYICSSCQNGNNYLHGPCSNCGLVGAIQL